MDTKQPNPMTRADTLFGVCQALADDFGINPLWLRIPIASGILVHPLGAVGVYFGLGLLVLVSRLVFPTKVQASAPVLQQVSAEPVQLQQDTRELAEAA